MFWTVLLLIVCFSIVACVLFWMLAMLIGGEWALGVTCLLLLAGVITAFISACQKITDRLDSVAEKLDELLEEKKEGD